MELSTLLSTILVIVSVPERTPITSHTHTHTPNRIEMRKILNGREKNLCWLRVAFENSYCRRIQLISFCFLTVRVVFLVVAFNAGSAQILFARAQHGTATHTHFVILCTYKYLWLPLFASHLMCLTNDYLISF